MLSEEKFANTLKEDFGIERVGLYNVEVTVDAIELIGCKRARGIGVLPFVVSENSFKLAIS